MTEESPLHADFNYAEAYPVPEVTLEEFQAFRSNETREMFARMDRNSDGVISREDFPRDGRGPRDGQWGPGRRGPGGPDGADGRRRPRGPGGHRGSHGPHGGAGEHGNR